MQRNTEILSMGAGRVLAGFALASLVASCALTQRAELKDQNYCPFLGSALCADGAGGENFFYSAPQQALSQKFAIVTEPGPGVMTIQVALDNFTAADAVLRSVSLVEPHARALATLKYVATGTYPFVGAAQAEGKITDSVTGQVLAAAVSRRVGGGSAKAADQWNMGDAENALNYWAQRLTTLLASWTSGSSTPS